MERITNTGLMLIIQSIDGYSSQQTGELVLNITTDDGCCKRIIFNEVECVRISSVYECHSRLHTCVYDFLNSSLLVIEDSKEVMKYKNALDPFKNIQSLNEYFVSDCKGRALFVLSRAVPQVVE